MKLVLSHRSALEYWRSVGTLRLPRPKPTRARTPGDRIADTEVLALCRAHALSRPLHLLVPKSERRFRTRDVVYHARDELLPQGSLAVIDDGLFVVSPELAFVQRSAEVNFAKLVNTGYELCGTYTPSDSPTDRDFGQLPQTNPVKLSSYLEKAGAMHGIAQARRALRHVLPNSASPAETALSMLLTLPYQQGGCSLPHPQLNYRIDPGKHARKNVSQNYYRCDLFWDKTNLAVEYDSNLYHTGAERIARDSKRRDELLGLGVTVVTVTAGQLFNFQEFNKVARTVAKRLGERIRPRNEDFATQQLALRSILLTKLERPLRVPSTRSVGSAQPITDVNGAVQIDP
ncbi:hypothetical protein [Gordonibacter massiliensis (ex Traore et al. 2017)]|uniref:hypothetical protein n=1 Tax=Gordonibacter massiliensis (ex Traore et al. 2017) TaxID=1841863 RepID=UPI001C8B682C|nr:hypothetical protein [Gordonibacter massiliensis (ex Traore et al. 2017)]MBX9035139.1 hypothetical protein [Gordonibacter massiliensis (ex Traore et al. 2017)]